MVIEKIKGFLSLSKEQQQLFLRVHAAHQKVVEDKAKWQPTSVRAQKNYIKVTFANGERLHYEPFCKWH